MSLGTMFDRGTYQGYDTAAMRRNWIWLLILGIALMVLGTIALVTAVPFTVASVLLFGVLLVTGGLLHAFQAFGARDWTGVAVHLVLGLLYLVVGGVLMANPIGGAVSLTLVLGIFLLAAGIFRAVLALQMRPARNWGWLLLSGVIALVLGLVILAGWPGTGLWVIGLFVGIEFLVSGWGLVMFALGSRSVPTS